MLTSRRALAFFKTLPQNPARGRDWREAGMVDFQAARRAMVDGQVRTSDVTDARLVAAMLDIPREAFVPPSLAALAYADRDLPLDCGDEIATARKPARLLARPMVLARLVQAADLEPQDRLLVVGAGTGYAAAVASRLAASVTALEEDPKLAARARAVLSECGIASVTVAEGPLAQGWPAAAPYDVILFDGGVEGLPEALFSELASMGRLVAVVIVGMVGKGMVFRSERGQASGRALFDAMAPMLPGFKKAPTFVF
jgi:protein-L-isoaspartate(D-aspartate) O-methyltransferase